MDKEKLEGLIIDYVDGRLGEEEKTLLEGELSHNAEAYQLYEQTREVIQAMDRSAKLEPSLKLKRDFDQFLKEELARQKQTKVVSFYPTLYRAAAAVFLVLSGVAIGYWINKNQQREEEMAALKQQMQEMRDMMMAKLDNQQSASQRMIAVSEVMEMEKPDDEIVKVLVKTMNEDANTNVRLAALEALSKFHQEPLVRKELVKSLAKQNDPVVQIALIQLMVKMKEKGVVNELQHIVDDAKSMKAVKDEAYSGLLKLS
jgi:anti-sigma factor RsiW